MIDVSPERRIAIAFIRSFRMNMDETLKPSQTIDKLVAQQSTIAMYFLFGEAVSPPPAFADKLRSMFSELNNEFICFLDKTYDSVLVSSVSQGLSKLEEYLKSQFLKEELEELSKMLESNVVRRVIADSSIFDILRKEYISMQESMSAEYTKYITSPENQDRIRNVVQEFISKSNIDDIDKDDQDDRGSLDPEDIF